MQTAIEQLNLDIKGYRAEIERYNSTLLMIAQDTSRYVEQKAKIEKRLKDAEAALDKLTNTASVTDSFTVTDSGAAAPVGFTLNQVVIVNLTKQKATVTTVSLSNRAPTYYEVEYAHEGERKTGWFTAAELTPA